MQEIGVIGPYELHLFDSFDDAAQAWDSIVEPLSDCPFFRRGWLELWYSTIGSSNGSIPAIAALRSTSGRYVAVLPFCFRRRGSLRQLEWMGAGVTDYCGPLLETGIDFDQAMLMTAARTVAGKLKCEIVCLERNPERIAGTAMPYIGPAFTECHYRSHSFSRIGNEGSDGTSLLSSKSRYNLRRAEKQLRELGTVEYVVADTADQACAFTTAMMEHKQRRYWTTGAHDILSDPAFRSFYERSCLSPEIPVHVSAILLDGVPIAEHWGLVDRDSLYVIMPTFDEESYGKYSIGSLLVIQLLKDSLHRGLGWVDFTIGDEEYKKRWCNEETRMFTLVFGTCMAGRAVALFRRSLALLKHGRWVSFLRKARKQAVLVSRKLPGR